MSRPSDATVVWEAHRPIPRRQIETEAARALVFHYYRLIRLILTGRDCLK